MLSVLGQTYSNIEYIVIDGGSTDGTVDEIKKYADRLAYWVSEPDKGIYDAMNKGIRQAHGKWINFMNAGDSFYAPDVLSKVFGEGKYNADYMIGVAKSSNGFYLKPVRTDFTYREVRAGGINHQASFIRLSLFSDDCYRIKYRIIADELFFVKKVVFEGCSHVCLPFIICNYDANGVSSNSNAVGMIRQERSDFMKEYLPVRLLGDYMETDKEALKRLLRKTVWYTLKRIFPKKLLRMFYDSNLQWFVNLSR